MENSEYSFDTQEGFQRQLTDLLGYGASQAIDIEGAYDCHLPDDHGTFDVEISRVDESVVDD